MAHNIKICKNCSKTGMRSTYSIDLDEYCLLDNEVITSWGKVPCPKDEENKKYLMGEELI